MTQLRHGGGKACVDRGWLRDVHLNAVGLGAKPGRGLCHGLGVDIGQGDGGAFGDIGAGEF